MSINLKIRIPPIWFRVCVAWIKHKHTVDNYWIWDIESAIFSSLGGVKQNVKCKRCGYETSFEYSELLNKAREELKEYLPA